MKNFKKEEALKAFSFINKPLNELAKMSTGSVDALALISSIEALESKTGRDLLSDAGNPLERLPETTIFEQIAHFFSCEENQIDAVRCSILFAPESIVHDQKALSEIIGRFAENAGCEITSEFLNSKMMSHKVHDMQFCDWDYIIYFVEMGSPWQGPSLAAITEEMTVLDVAKMFTRSMRNPCPFVAKAKYDRPKKAKVVRKNVADNPQKIEKLIEAFAAESGHENTPEFQNKLFAELKVRGLPKSSTPGDLITIIEHLFTEFTGPLKAEKNDTVLDVAKKFSYMTE